VKQEMPPNSPESPGPVIDVGIQVLPFQVIVPVEGGEPGELLYGPAATHRLADTHDRSVIPAEPVVLDQVVPFHSSAPPEATRFVSPLVWATAIQNDCETQDTPTGASASLGGVIGDQTVPFHSTQ
jgi:hypothetical protein